MLMEVLVTTSGTETTRKQLGVVVKPTFSSQETRQASFSFFDVVALCIAAISLFALFSGEFTPE